MLFLKYFLVSGGRIQFLQLEFNACFFGLFLKHNQTRCMSVLAIAYFNRKPPAVFFPNTIGASLPPTTTHIKIDFIQIKTPGTYLLIGISSVSHKTVLKPEIIVSKHFFDYLLDIHGVSKGVADISVLENFAILIEPHPLGGLLCIIKKPYFVYIAVFYYGSFGFYMPVPWHGNREYIHLGFFKILPDNIYISNYLKHHSIHIKTIFEKAKVFSPPVFFPLKFYVLAFFKIINLVRAGIGNNFPVVSSCKIFTQFTVKMPGCWTDSYF